MGKTRDLFKKMRDIKETFQAKMSTIKDRNDMDLTETKEEVARNHRTIKKDLNDPDNHDGVDHSPRARHPTVQSQVGLWKHHYKQS